MEHKFIRAVRRESANADADFWHRLRVGLVVFGLILLLQAIS